MNDDRLAYATSAAARRPRLAPGELRRRMLDAALQMVEQAGGLTVSLAHLNMEEIIRLAMVPRSSVYREWGTREDFYVELIVALIEPEPDQSLAFDVQTLRLAHLVVDDNAERLGTVDGRREVLREAIRLGTLRNYQMVCDSLQYRTTTALLAALPAFTDAQRRRVGDAVRSAEFFFADRMVNFYEAFLPRLGFRMRASFTERHLATAAASIVEGMSRRNSTTPEPVNTPVSYPGLDGEQVDWHMAALALLGVVEFMVEPIPDWASPPRW